MIDVTVFTGDVGIFPSPPILVFSLVSFMCAELFVRIAGPLFWKVCNIIAPFKLFPFRELQNTPDAVPDSGIEPPPLDSAWVEATRKKALLKLEKLDTDLKNYKGNSIKESIRWDAEGSAGARKSILLLQAPNTGLSTAFSALGQCVELLVWNKLTMSVSEHTVHWHFNFCAPGEAMMT